MISYVETAAEYHANPAIGSGDIRAFIRSPRLFRDQMDGAAPRETTAMKFGSTAHLAMLEPATYESLVVIKPEDVNFSTKEGKAWKAANGTGKIIVPFKDSGKLVGMRARMPAEVAGILGRAKCEVTVRTEIDGIAVQCRIDAWDQNKGCKYDLKTISAIENVERDIYKRGYHIQDRWYGLVLGTDLGSRKSCPDSALIFVETNPPYRWRIVRLDAEYRMIADDAIDRAWIGIRERMASGKWDDDDIHLLASPPPWMAEDDDETDEEDAA